MPEGNAVAVVPRGITIGVAVVLLILSAATLGIINGTDGLNFVRDQGQSSESNEVTLLQALIVGTEGASAWNIVMSIIVIAAQSSAIVLLYLPIPPIAKLIIGIAEIIFGVVMIVCYFGTGISAAVYAAAWGAPPALCDLSDTDYCNSIPLTATCALQALLCFVQIGMLGAVIVVAILGIIKYKSQTASATDIKA